jgi:hypothetical protein
MRLTFPLSLALVCLAGIACAQNIDKVDPAFLEHAHPKTIHPTPYGMKSGLENSQVRSIAIDSIPTFNGQFSTFGFDSNGEPNRHWYINTVGNPSHLGKTTTIGAPIQPVNVELDDAHGHLKFDNGRALILTASEHVSKVLASPVFARFKYSSSPEPTQFADAVQRAEFYSTMDPSWHTILAPRQLPTLTVHLRQSDHCPSGPNNAGCNYVYALNPNGTCCAFILVNDAAPDFFFDAALGDVVGKDIANNSITTKDISSFLFSNVFLFDGDTSQCCILGFHNYFFNSTPTTEQRWVIDFASWISPGLFGSTFTDVTGLSHEITEIYNDPFLASDGVHNLTPWWLAPNGNCGETRETGDVIEGLPNSTYTIVGKNGFTYHPQNEALLQWFEFKDPSNAIDGAYSYPDTNVLQSPSWVQEPGCR